ncbi:hypothetical protein ACH4TV_08585 [Streptomyces sp. NPDC020898]|uniref:hypothetical protein n=1 Tax=Streptomyces sp. NPDC020898 TaxID=3365101 RepID=UPI0037B5BD20
MDTSISAIVSKESLSEGLRLILRDLEETDDGLALPASDRDSGIRSIKPLTNHEMNEIIDNLKEADSNTDSSFHWKDHAEFTIVPLSAHRMLERFFDGTTLSGQGDNPISYSIGDPSREVIAYLACYLAQNKEILRSPRWAIMRHRVMRALSAGTVVRGEADRDDTILGAVEEVLGVTALRVSSPKPRSDFETLANSFLFHVAYNTDMAARIGLDPTLEVRRIQRVRRTARGSLDVPRKSYTSDLIHHYMMGVASEIPLLEYLSYYHIAEHYFEKVFNDDLIEQVRRGITDPSFSVRRAKDVQSIIRIVDRTQRQVKEEGGVNEQRALQLVLGGFVDINRLIADLNGYDGDLVNYYRTHDVPFAGAQKVDLESRDHATVHAALAKRIYKVRNALVHAKEGELPKYAPFAHDAELSHEIPLMRFTAEQIVIAHGRVL